MLILSRKENERIFIGDDVTLVVLGVENNRVKLGIDAPSEIAIVREEISDNPKARHNVTAAETVAAKADLKTGT